MARRKPPTLDRNALKPAPVPSEVRSSRTPGRPKTPSARSKAPKYPPPPGYRGRGLSEIKDEPRDTLTDEELEYVRSVVNARRQERRTQKSSPPVKREANTELSETMKQLVQMYEAGDLFRALEWAFAAVALDEGNPTRRKDYYEHAKKASILNLPVR